MRRFLPWLVPLLMLMLLAGCGREKSVFSPTVSIQQLQVMPDGNWHMEVRMLNNSYRGMRFRSFDLTMTLNNTITVPLTAQFDVSIAKLSAGVTSLTVKPSPAAAKVLEAIAGKGSAGSVAYSLTGTISAREDADSDIRTLAVDNHDWLSGVPGVANTYR